MRRAFSYALRCNRLCQYTIAPSRVIQQPTLRAMSTSAAPGPSSAVQRPAAAPSLRDLQPPQHIGMKELDRDAFVVKLPLTTVRVPASSVGAIRKSDVMKGQVVDISKIKTILHDADPAFRRVVLRVKSADDLPEPTRAYLATLGAEYNPYEIELGYDHWSAHEILTAIIPSDEDDVPASFTQTGHIAHVNLRDEWLPYKHIVGQVILDKVPSIRTVVNKLKEIHAQFRFFDMEVLAGDRDFITSTSESGCSFTFDFSKVYWNSRLHTEHDRLISQFQPGQVVADAMAGVGPFAVPAAKRGVYVLGNDLNPESVKWMRENQLRNKVESRLRVSERDAREFITSAALEAWKSPFERSEAKTHRQKDKEAKEARARREQGIPEPPKEPAAPQTIDHFVMNLPDSALEFLDAYNGAFTPLLKEEGYDKETILPMIHVHCFTRFIEPEPAAVDICERATSTLGHNVTPEMEGFNLHLVRRVAPKKDMYCLSFRLPKEVAYRQL